jgi:hypothetical protein
MKFILDPRKKKISHEFAIFQVLLSNEVNIENAEISS